LENATGARRQQRFSEARVVGCCGEEVLVIVRNITLRRQAENDLRHREAELRSLLRASEVTS
ncbi:MAG: hypothetical protein JWN40_2620, partial [Phycisphaerales bacterium]|nr:hypothetical protein [Phycisphaerales bacterium]